MFFCFGWCLLSVASWCFVVGVLGFGVVVVAIVGVSGVGSVGLSGSAGGIGGVSVGGDCAVAADFKKM